MMVAEPARDYSLRRMLLAAAVGALLGTLGSWGFAWAVRTGLVSHAFVDRYRAAFREQFLRVLPGLILYGAFMIYWTLAARDTAPSESSESKCSSYLHQILWSAAFLLVIVPVPPLTRRFLPRTYLMLALGLAVQAGGTWLAVWARRHLGRNWSAVRIAVGHELICTGPYRLLRHPIYTGVLGMFLGLAMAAGRVHALLGLALLAFAYRRKIHLEERILEKTFGAQFQAYQRRTWALIPLLF